MSELKFDLGHKAERLAVEKMVDVFFFLFRTADDLTEVYIIVVKFVTRFFKLY